MSKVNSITLLFFVLLLSACFETGNPNLELVGKVMPDFKLYINDGKTEFQTRSLENGQPVVLFFVSPECHFCREELTSLINSIDKFKDVKILVATPTQDSKFVAFKKEFHLDKYPNIISGIDKDNFLVKKYGIQNVPYTLTFDKEKKVTKVFDRPVEPEEIISALYN